MRAYLSIMIAMMMIGGNIPLGKILIETIPPTSFVMLRLALSSLILLPLASREPGSLQSLGNLRPRQWLDIILLSLFGGVLFTTLMMIGVRYTPAINAGIISSALPAAIAVLSFLILRERISARTAASVALAVVGIAFLNLATPPSPSGPASPSSGQGAILLGNAFVFAAICSEAMFAVLSRRYAARIPPWTLALLVHAIGVPLTLPVMVLMDGGFVMGETTPLFWLLTAYYILTASLLSFYLWCYGVKSVEASTAGLFTAFVPVTSLIVSLLFLGESLSLLQLCGLVTIFLSLFLGLSSRPGEKARSDP